MELLIKDPVHNYISFNRRTEQTLLDVLSSFVVQRLRRISQLGTAHIAYPGAEHSRFAHSIGTTHIVRRIMEHLRDTGAISHREYKEEIEPVSIAALIHDIGHGPFSHLFEEYTSYSHEQVTLQLLREHDELLDRLTTHHIDYPVRVASIISRQYDRAYIKTLISSQIDADRLDYVLRDATMCGVKYGIFDLDRILHAFQLHDRHLVLSHKGKGALEEYLLARYFMYWHVYYHKTTIGYGKILLNCLRRAQQLFEEGTLHYITDPLAQFMEGLTNKTIDIQAYLLLDDSDILVHVKRWMTSKDDILREFAHRLLYRKLLKSITVSNEEKLAGVLEEIRSALKHAEKDPAYYLIQDTQMKSIYHYYAPDTGERNEQNIFIEDEDGQYVEISKLTRSQIRHFISTRDHQSIIFIPHEILPILEKKNILKELRADDHSDSILP